MTSLINRDLIKNQIDEIISAYPKAEIIDAENGIISINIHPKVKITLDFGEYPKRPELEIPAEILSILGKPSKFLKTYSNWKSKKNPSVLEIIKEFQAIIDANSSEELSISQDLVDGILQWIKDQHPREVQAFLDENNGVVDEFILSDKGISRVNDWRNGFTREPDIFGSLSSHNQHDLEPTETESKRFRLHKINMIIAYPYTYNDIKIYDKNLREVPFKFIKIQDSNPEIKKEINKMINEDINDN